MGLVRSLPSRLGMMDGSTLLNGLFLPIEILKDIVSGYYFCNHDLWASA